MQRLHVSPTITSSGGCQLRHRFYKPIMNAGVNLWKAHQGRSHRGFEIWDYKHSKLDPRPAPETSVNSYFGRTRLWNPLVSKMAIINKKSEDWGYPLKEPPPTGLRRSPEYFPYFMAKYFPNVECNLLFDSILNTETTRPVFMFPSDMSKQEIALYLKNLYNIDNIVSVQTKNIAGRRYKNEVGAIKLTEQKKLAFVTLDTAVKIELKQIKGTDDGPDSNKALKP